MKLKFSRVHSLLLTCTLAAAIFHPLVAQALTTDKIIPTHNSITQLPNSLIKKVRPIYAQTKDNPPRHESTGGSR